MVVVVGDTVIDVPVTVPMPWLIEMVSESVTDQFKVELSPTVIPGGLAVKELIIGLLGVTLSQADKKRKNKVMKITRRYLFSYNILHI